MCMWGVVCACVERGCKSFVSVQTIDVMMEVFPEVMLKPC